MDSENSFLLCLYVSVHIIVVMYDSVAILLDTLRYVLIRSDIYIY